jgi:hypothetical protein
LDQTRAGRPDKRQGKQDFKVTLFFYLRDKTRFILILSWIITCLIELNLPVDNMVGYFDNIRLWGQIRLKYIVFEVFIFSTYYYII